MRKQLGNLKMTKKLLVSPLTAILFLFIFGLVCYAGFFKQKSALDDITNNRFGKSLATAGLIKDLTEVHAKVYKTITMLTANWDKAKIDVVIREQDEKLVKIADAVARLEKSQGLTKEERDRIAEVKKDVTQYEEYIKDNIKQAIENPAMASIPMNNQADPFFWKMNEKLNALMVLENKLGKEQYASSNHTFTVVLAVTAVVLAAALFFSFAVALIMRGVIIAPIKKTITAIESAAGGDLTVRIDVDSRDELGDMASHFNVFADKLHEAISQVAGTSDQVLSAAHTLDQATEQMASGVEEAAMQAHSVAAASEEMSKTTSEIAHNCVMAAKNSDEANRTATTGETVVNKTLDVMKQINDRVQESARTIRELGSRSEQIGQIVGLINDVADQTNLLALNAAIEAARAGEHGRGFAVVADEVRKLAERTSEATKEISTTIGAMQTETKKAVSSMEEGVKEVAVGIAEAAKSSEAIKGVLDQIGKVTGEINQIAVASEQETSTVNEIATSIQQISEVSVETSRRIQENAVASAGLSNLSKSLREMVGRFRLN